MTSLIARKEMCVLDRSHHGLRIGASLGAGVTVGPYGPIYCPTQTLHDASQVVPPNGVTFDLRRVCDSRCVGQLVAGQETTYVLGRKRESQPGHSRIQKELVQESSFWESF